MDLSRRHSNLTRAGKDEALKLVEPTLYRLIYPGSWCQRFEAVDAQGRSTRGSGRRARSFCLLGALRATYAEARSRPSIGKVSVNAYEFAIEAIFDTLEHVRPWNPSANRRMKMYILEDWNDDPSTTHEDVVNLLQLTREALHG